MKPRILVVDNEQRMCLLIKQSLELENYEVLTAFSGQEALNLIDGNFFDIVITDLKMKGIDGMQFLTEVKKQSPKTEVIVITGFATMETAKESFQKGVFDFLAKPFKLREIQDVIQKIEIKLRPRE